VPTRYLKSGIRDSDALDSLSPLTETLFYRLLVTVDDFGRYDARPAMIKAQCFPIKESIKQKDCASMLCELEKSGLIIIYHHEGKEYLQMCKWDNVPRAKESKFPQPNADAVQLHTDVKRLNTNLPLTVTVTETETVTKTEKKEQRGSRLASDWVLSKSWGDWATNERPDLDIRRTADDFRDYWHSVAGSKGIKLDWQATWRVWVRGQRAPATKLADVARQTVPSSGEHEKTRETIAKTFEGAKPPTLEQLALLASIRGSK
jgi:hypothetical protein